MALLEGLEISEILLSDVFRLSNQGRLDSHFFQQKFVDIRLKSESWTALKDIASKVECGPFGSNLLNTNYVDSGIPMVRPFNLRQCRSDYGEVALLEEAFIENSSLSTFGKNSVFFARVGDIGASANVYRKATISPNIIAANVPNEIDAQYISVFASTEYGNCQLEAEVKAVAQPTISTETVRDFRIPLFSISFRSVISETYCASEHHLDSSKKYKAESEQTLLTALGLEDWQPPNKLTYEASAKTAFSSGRIDAEFFQPKYIELSTLIKKTGKATSLSELTCRISRGKQPEYTNTGLFVINSKHVHNGSVNLSDNRHATYDKHSLFIEKGDVLINGTGVGTIGRTAPYLEEAKALPDNHVTILRTKNAEIDPIYLSIFLNSAAGQMQVEQYFKGSSGQIELYPEDISNFQIWLAPKLTQEKIRDKYLESRAARQESKRLLERAKRAVEIAIEQDEATALAYLDKK